MGQETSTPYVRMLKHSLAVYGITVVSNDIELCLKVFQQVMAMTEESKKPSRKPSAPPLPSVPALSSKNPFLSAALAELDALEDSDDEAGAGNSVFAFPVIRPPPVQGVAQAPYYEGIGIEDIGRLKKAVSLYGPQSHYVKELVNGLARHYNNSSPEDWRVLCRALLKEPEYLQWQMWFSELCMYVHVVMDTYSQFIWATAQSGETTQHVISHLLETFAVMGLPSIIKTDNGPAYSSKKFQTFCKQYGIMHKTGIEYNPQGQAIVERAHNTLKLQIKKLKRRKKDHILAFTQSNACSILQQALFTLNFLNLPQGDILSRAEKQFIEGEVAPPPLNEHIWFKPTADAEWQPGLLLCRGKGYAYVSTEDGRTCSWLPARWIRPRANLNGTISHQTTDGESRPR
ncbi:uncharacterized protein LOC135361866 [Mirounga angustirostris]|uniref:uncharacterized protein LOC135361866 n=1 Tax=Mirounga angustirostris TaxID=9716 RepID=UPI00313E89E1